MPRIAKGRIYGLDVAEGAVLLELSSVEGTDDVSNANRIAVE